jgi:hypothetical protein
MLVLFSVIEVTMPLTFCPELVLVKLIMLPKPAALVTVIILLLVLFEIFMEG